MNTTVNETERSPWLDRQAAAEYLGVNVDTLAQMATRGTGPRYSKPSKRLVRYHVRDLDLWLESSTRTSTGNDAA